MNDVILGLDPGISVTDGDCRIKSDNDMTLQRVILGLDPGISVYKKYSLAD